MLIDFCVNPVGSRARSPLDAARTVISSNPVSAEFERRLERTAHIQVVAAAKLRPQEFLTTAEIVAQNLEIRVRLLDSLFQARLIHISLRACAVREN